MASVQSAAAFGVHTSPVPQVSPTEQVLVPHLTGAEASTIQDSSNFGVDLSSAA